MVLALGSRVGWTPARKERTNERPYKDNLPMCDALSGRGSLLSPVASAYQRTISNNSYAHDEQGVNSGQVRGFNGVLYKL